MLSENALRPMIDKVEADPETGAVGPKLLNLDGFVQIGFTNKRFPNLRSLLCEMLPPRFWAGSPLLQEHLLGWSRNAYDAEHLTGACLLVRRQALDQVGLLNEQFRF